jgi:hypothetical protein
MLALPSRLASHPLVCCLIVALIPRLFIALCLRTYYAPDEIFQYIEQAHRVVFHQGFVPWEFQVGLRSWLIPLLVAVPMEIAHWFTPSPLPGLLLIRILCCIASLSIVWCATRWGQIYAGLKGAWLAGMLSAIWPDLWLMAPHPLEESFAAYVFLPAIYLTILHRRNAHTKHVLTAGFLLGLTFALREQLAPAIAITGIYLCGRNTRHWLLAVGVAALPVLLTGILDWLTWGEMFRSFWMNIYLNLTVGIAAHFFSSDPAVYYPLNLLYVWLWGAFVLAWLAWHGARRLPLAGVVALVIIVEHSLISHKELRYIFPAIALLVPLAGLGLAHALQPGATWRNGLILAALLTGPFMSPPLYMMLGWQNSASRLYIKLAAHDPRLVAIEAWDRGLLPILPVFGTDTRFTDMTGAPYADAIVAYRGSTAVPTGFTLGGCAAQSRIPFKPRQPDICFWTRPASFAQPALAAPFTLVYPPAARAFVIPDRLIRVP